MWWLFVTILSVSAGNLRNAPFGPPCDYSIDGHTVGEFMRDTQFHVADRIHGNNRHLRLPGCVDHGKPMQRYFYAAPAQYDPLQKLGINADAPNQVDVWAEGGQPAGTFATTVNQTNVTMSVYESRNRLDCRVVDGQLLEVYP